MTREKYKEQFDKVLMDMQTLAYLKNADYADENDTFVNFKQIEHLTSGRTPTEIGILTRMSDKMTRIANLLSREAKVNEKITDTLNDLAVYAIILRIYLEEKANETSLKEGSKTSEMVR